MIIIPTNLNFSKKILELPPPRHPICGYDFYLKKKKHNIFIIISQQNQYIK